MGLMGLALNALSALSGPERADGLTDPGALDIVTMDMASSGSPERSECHGFILDMQSQAIPEGIGKAPGKASSHFQHYITVAILWYLLLRIQQDGKD